MTKIRLRLGHKVLITAHTVHYRQVGEVVKIHPSRTNRFYSVQFTDGLDAPFSTQEFIPIGKNPSEAQIQALLSLTYDN